MSTFQSTVKLIDVFNLLFNSNNIFMSTIRISHISSNLILQIPLIMGLYILTPLIALYTISILKDKANNTLIENDDEQFGMKYLKILPHVNKNEKLEFLEAYFSGGIEIILKDILK